MIHDRKFPALLNFAVFLSKTAYLMSCCRRRLVLGSNISKQTYKKVSRRRGAKLWRSSKRGRQLGDPAGDHASWAIWARKVRFLWDSEMSFPTELLAGLERASRLCLPRCWATDRRRHGTPDKWKRHCIMASANFWSFYCKTCTSEYSKWSLPVAFRHSRVHQIRPRPRWGSL